MKLLGEIEVELGVDDKVVLKPTFEGLVVMEEKSGKSIGDLFDGFIKAKIGIKDIASVIYGGMYGASGNRNPKYTFEQIGQKVLVKGVVYFPECGVFVAAAYSGKPISEFKATEKVEEKKT